MTTESKPELQSVWNAEFPKTPLTIAVVGHTNTGKTSLMRTLLRDAEFGEVSNRPSTTRHVAAGRLLLNGQPAVTLFDTPGFEDSVALAEYVDDLTPRGQRIDGPQRIEIFLASPEAKRRFEQEAKVLRQVLASDAALYVIDARDPVLPKHRDELALLASCAKPVIPVLNFVSKATESAAQGDETQSIRAWKTALARLGLHAQIAFDSVLPELGGERQLFEKWMTLLDDQRPLLAALIDQHSQEARRRRETAARLIADLLIDVAACRRWVPDQADEATLNRAIQDLHDAIREREGVAISALLNHYRFRPNDVDAKSLPLIEGRWESDLFAPETLKTMGLRLGQGAAAGAAAGVGVDLLAGGLTLGAAAALGAAVGGGWQTFQHYGSRIKGRLSGQRELSVDDVVLRLLALREQTLFHMLERRGHAATDPIALNAPDLKPWKSGKLPAGLAKARAHPEWSTLTQWSAIEPSTLERRGLKWPSFGLTDSHADREEACRALAAHLIDAHRGVFA